MSSYEFQSISYPTPRAMLAAIVDAWLTAGGSNTPNDISEALIERTDEELADEVIDAWALDQPEMEESEATWLAARGCDRGDLVSAFADYRGIFAGQDADRRLLLIEDNAGGLHMAMRDGDGDCTVLESSLEQQHAGNLRRDMRTAISDPESIELSVDDPAAVYTDLMAQVDAGTAKVIAEGYASGRLVIHEDRMGAAGLRYLGRVTA